MHIILVVSDLRAKLLCHLPGFRRMFPALQHQQMIFHIVIDRAYTLLLSQAIIVVLISGLQFPKLKLFPLLLRSGHNAVREKFQTQKHQRHYKQAGQRNHDLIHSVKGTQVHSDQQKKENGPQHDQRHAARHFPGEHLTDIRQNISQKEDKENA